MNNNPKNFEHGISIDAYRGHDDEPWRLDRLNLFRKILQYHDVQFTGGKTYIVTDRNKCVAWNKPARVTFLYDHKGNLAVQWTGTPDKEQIDQLETFWNVVFCEPIADHFVDVEQITDNAGWNEAPFPPLAEQLWRTV